MTIGPKHSTYPPRRQAYLCTWPIDDHQCGRVATVTYSNGKTGKAAIFADRCPRHDTPAARDYAIKHGFTVTEL